MDGNYALGVVVRMAHVGIWDSVTIYQTVMDGGIVRVNSSIRLHCQCDYNRSNYIVFAINCILLLLPIIYFSCAQDAVISKYSSAVYAVYRSISFISVRCQIAERRF